MKVTLLFLFGWLFAGSLTLQAQLVANFEAQNGYQKTDGTGIVVCRPDEVDFVSTSTYNGNPINFGDPDYKYEWTCNPPIPNVITQERPSVPYTAVGSYNVTLKITKKSSGESASITINNYVEVVEKPIIDFAIDNPVGCVPLQVNLTNLSTVAGDPNKTVYSWVVSGAGSANTKDASFNITSPGSYPVSLEITDEYGCSQFKTQNNAITAKRQPKSGFSSDVTTVCDPPLNFTLTPDETDPNFNYTWEIESLGSFNTRTVSGVLNAVGSYDVKLTIDGGLGCFAELEKKNYLQIVDLVADFSMPDTICPGEKVDFSFTGSGASTYSWDFGDGSTSNKKNPDKKWNSNAVGNFTVCLTVSSAGNVCTKQICKVIHIDELIPKFTIDNKVGCKIPHVINVDASGSTYPNNTDFSWNFGGNGITETHSYNSFGDVFVKLTMTSPTGCKVEEEQEVRIRTLVLDAEADGEDGCVPLNVNFTDNTNYNGQTVASRTWEVVKNTDPTTVIASGGSTGSLNFSHTFTDPGQYTVYLKITNSDGCSSTKTVPVSAGSKPIAGFYLEPQDTCAFEFTNFIDTSYVIDQNGNKRYDLIDYYLWKHPEGPNQVKDPKVKYTQTGHDTLNGIPEGTSPGTRDPYDVELIVGYFGCQDTVKKRNYWEKWGPVLGSLQGTRPCGSDTLYVYGSMFAWTFRQWEYDFKDTDGIRSDSIIQEIFPSYQDTTFNGLTVNSTTHSQATATTDTLKIYAPTGFDGTVTVKLYNNAYESCDSCAAEFIFVWDDVLDFKFNIPDAICLNTDAGSGSVPLVPENMTGSFRWVASVNGSNPTEIGRNRSITYTPADSGTHRICLQKNWNQPCADQVCKELKVQVPEVEVELQSGNFVGCRNLVADVAGKALNGDIINVWDWYVIDTTANPNDTIQYINGQDPPAITFTSSGDFFISLAAEDDIGCKTQATFGEIVNVIDPKAAFTVNQVGYCLGDPIKLTNNSTFAEPLTYEWYLNDSLISTEENPTNLLTKVDTFDIKLIVKAGSCGDTLIRKNAISVDPIPIFDFNADLTTDACPPLITKLNSEMFSEAYSGYTFEWDLGIPGAAFGVGDTTDAFYAAPGSYDVKLTVSTPNGCIDSVIKPNYINLSGPFADGITSSRIDMCVNDSFDITILGGINADLYTFNFGDGNSFTKIPGVDNPDSVYRYAYETGFVDPIEVTVFVETNSGCRQDYSITLNVEDLTALIAPIEPDTLCSIPQTVTFVNNSVSFTDFNWDLGDGNGFTKNDTRTFTQYGEYEVTLEVEDNVTGCQDTDKKKIWIFEPPSLQQPRDTVLCANEVLDLQIVGSQSTDLYSWSPTSGLSNPNSSQDSSFLQLNPAVSTTYSIVGLDTLTTCTDTVKVLVQRDSTFIDFTLDQPGQCDNTLLGITYPTGYVGSTNEWNIQGDFHNTVDNTLITSYQITQPDTVELSLSGYDKAANCVQTINKQVIVYPLPTVDIIPDSVICDGSSIVLVSSGGDQIQWAVNPITEVLPIGYDPTVSPTDDVEYTMTVTDQTTLCQNDTFVKIFVDKALANIEIDRLDSCDFGNVELKELGSVGEIFFMDWGDGVIDTLSPPLSLSAKNYQTPGVYEQVFIARDNLFGKTFCQDTLRWSFQVYPLPDAKANSPEQLICNYDTIQLTASGGELYQWTPANSLSSDVVQNPFAFPDFNTLYEVTVTDTNKCQNTAQVQVNVVPEYIVDPKQMNDTIFIGDTIHLSFEVVDSISFAPYEVSIEWDNDYTTDCNDCDFTIAQPLVTSTYGIYTIDPDACYPKFFNFEIFVVEKYVVDVPNAFSPNGDNNNDRIFVRGIGIKELLNFTIYNRWGEVVFNTSNIKEGWDGFYKDKLQNDETYVYRAGVLYYNGETESKQGYITILK
ncbi:MAG: PKD domain-containing protein [Luteibaculum sp.]